MRHARPLTAGETALARTIFGDAIDYARVRLANRKWWPFQPADTVMAPTGNIHFHPADRRWCDDFADACIGAQGLFLHELTHVWQSQHRGRWYLPLMRHPFCRYRYAIIAGRRFDAYGLEQQAEIVRHLFLARLGKAVPGMPALAQLEALLASAGDPRLAAQARL